MSRPTRPTRPVSMPWSCRGPSATSGRPIPTTDSRSVRRRPIRTSGPWCWSARRKRPSIWSGMPSSGWTGRWWPNRNRRRRGPAVSKPCPEPWSWASRMMWSFVSPRKAMRPGWMCDPHPASASMTLAPMRGGSAASSRWSRDSSRRANSRFLKSFWPAAPARRRPGRSLPEKLRPRRRSARLLLSVSRNGSVGGLNTWSLVGRRHRTLLDQMFEMGVNGQ